MVVVKGGSKCNLITGYAEGEDNQRNYGKNRWLAQTFTLDDLYVIWRCRCKSWTNTGGEFYHYGLRDTDAFGKPLAVDICHTTLSPTGEYWYSPGKWRRFDFDAFPNLPAGVYALVFSVPDSIGNTRYKLRGDLTASPFTEGKAWESNDSGVTWTEIPNTDFIFEVWGWKPPPVADPDPVISNWAPLDYYHSSLLEGFTIVITTDIPCHLFLRWTDKPPLKHPMAEYRRGILVPIGTRYCFVAWEENEQLEPGDTLIHTFEKRNWPVCQTRYFYFIGTKQAEEQPSASPIFQLHRTAEYEPSVYGPIIGGLNSRTIRATHALWPNCHDAPAAHLGDWHDPPWEYLIAGATLTVSFWIERSFLFFDTSGIPPGSLIVAAVLSIFLKYLYHTSSRTYPFLCITQGVQTDPVVATNYGDQLPYTIIGGQKDLYEMVEGEYNHIDFNSDGLPWINIGGVTRLCLRQEMDIVDSSPPLGSNSAYYHSSQKGDGYQPLLTVYYVPP